MDDLEQLKNDMEAAGKKLNSRQKKFVEELEIDGIAYKAAERAGYSRKSAPQQASELLKNPDVARYRQARARFYFSMHGFGKAELGMKLMEILDRCLEGKEVMTWDSDSHSWVGSGVWAFDSKGAIKAIDSMAKLQGLYEQNLSIKPEESIEELMRKIGGGRNLE